MRTTVTLDDDLARRLKDVAHEQGVPFKTVINDAIRRGLRIERAAARPYRVEPVAMGRPRVDLTKSLRLAAEREDEEVTRKLEQGK